MIEAIMTPIAQPVFTRAPKEPAWFFERLLRLGGVSPTGLPMLRVVWSEQAQKILMGARVLAYPGTRKRELIGQNEHNNGRVIFHPIGAKETAFKPDSLIIEPVFDWVETLATPHWVSELWTPASDVAAGWNELLQGPFPVRGVYQIISHLVTPDGEYAPLTENTWSGVEMDWRLRCQSQTESPFIANSVEQQELRLKLQREFDAEEQAQRDKSRLDDITHLFVEDRRRLHDAVRADFG